MLVRFALRTAAVMALRGNTLVGQNVRDSSIGAIDIAADGSLRVNSDRPFADVFTDDSEVHDDTLWASGSLTFAVEYGIAQAMTTTDPETGESVIAGLDFPATDGAFEHALDILDRQVAAALTDPANEWAEVWRRLWSGRERKIERRRISREDDGVRRAARSLRITGEVRPDPVPGIEYSGMWEDFRALCQRDDATALDMLDAMWTNGGNAGALTVAEMRHRFGLAAAESLALGYDHRTPEEAAAGTIAGYDTGSDDDARSSS